ncbi:MAG: metallophosphoesterase family protein [Cyanophyceae cyanobacterium]
MSIKRRELLLLSSLSVGIAVIGKMLHAQAKAQDEVSYTTSTPEKKQIDTQQQTLLLRFVSLADVGTGDRKQYAVAEAMKHYYQQHPFPAVLLAGDNIYRNGTIKKIARAFEQPYSYLRQQGVKFFACLGNHDIRIANGNHQVQYPEFNMSGRYYTFRRGPVQFFALDTNRNAAWQHQLTWLEQELNRSKAPWKVVFGHHPLYSSGRYRFSRRLAPKLKPLFENYGVQLYINGHEHHYERTHSISGTTYVTCGSGARTRSVGRSSWTAHAASRLSFAAFDVYSDRLVIQGVDANGTVFDRAAIGLQG